MITKKSLLIASSIMLCTATFAQTDVTTKYLQNPDFTARYAGWVNEGATQGNVGGFQHQTNTSFTKKNGQIYMEKYVNAGSKVSNCHIRQTLRQLPTGTYTLTAGAQNLQGGNAGQTGAFLYAGDQQVEVSAAEDYSITFQSLGGDITIGFHTQGATGNHVCLDNFRLIKLETDFTALHATLQKQITEAQTLLGEATDANELTAAITTAQGLLTSMDESAIATGSEALRRAMLAHEVAGGTGKTPKVVTNPYVVMGSTIALGRSTVTTNGASIKEQGFCWSTTAEPTILDNRTTDFFNNNGKIYRMEGLLPATIYYVRAYAWTKDNQVTYGDVVKIATTPAGGVSYGYDNAGDDQINARINSSIAETVWMYNHLTNIQGVYLNVHYASGTPTADCSYGGWMRVGPNQSYQQTGTLLHETNHGVGVGTHWVWNDNASLRSNTTHGQWLGPQASEVIQFLNNDGKAFVQGDGTHMWGGSATSGAPGMKNYGINGAHEDSYSPADQLLYWGNILITHALHIDGLPCSNSVGFATPAYVFEQQDNQKYYLKSEMDEYGIATFLGHTSTGALRQINASMTEAKEDDNLAWYITYNPKTCYYTFQNVGTGRYIGLSDNTLRAVTGTAQPIHLFPSREKITKGKLSVHSYWITANKGAQALKATSAINVGTTSYSNAANAAAQRWLLLDETQLEAYDNTVKTEQLKELKELVKNVRALQAVGHTTKNENVDVTEVDNALEEKLVQVETDMENYASAGEVQNGFTTIQNAMLTFLSATKVTDVQNPFDLTFLIQSADISSDEGWSTSFTLENKLGEFYTSKAFDLNQTINLKLPIGTYKLKMQGFQRPGEYADVYTEYAAGTDNVKAMLYLKGETATLKNIYADANARTLGTGSVEAATGVWIPNTMQAAGYFFRRNLYDNEVLCTTTTAATMKLGLRCAATPSNYWTCFDNFRLYYYGNIDKGTVTPVEYIEDTQESGFKVQDVYYDLQGRRATKGQKGILIHNGKKIVY